MAGSFNTLPIPREPSSGRLKLQHCQTLFLLDKQNPKLESGANEKELCIDGGYAKV